MRTAWDSAALPVDLYPARLYAAVAFRSIRGRAECSPGRYQMLPTETARRLEVRSTRAPLVDDEDGCERKRKAGGEGEGRGDRGVVRLGRGSYYEFTNS